MRRRLSARRHSAKLTKGRKCDERGRQISCDHFGATGRSEGSAWFGALDPAFQEAVLASSRVKQLGAGEPYSTAATPDAIYCVLSGAVVSALSRRRAGDRS
jgi:hypothetical protein